MLSQSAYGYHLGRGAVEPIPSGIFFNALHLANGPDLSSTYEKGVDPLHYPAPHVDDSGDRSIAEKFSYVADPGSSVGNDGKNVRCLPILDVKVEVDIKSTIAKTLVTQTFTNLSRFVIKEANYSFPLYDESVVIQFRCHIGEDQVLEGVVKQKDVSDTNFCPYFSTGR
jgi:hypothetical protein